MGYFRSTNSRNNLNMKSGGSDGPLDMLFNNSSEQETANISERNDGVTDDYSLGTAEGEEAAGTGRGNKKLKLIPSETNS